MTEEQPAGSGAAAAATRLLAEVADAAAAGEAGKAPPSKFAQALEKRREELAAEREAEGQPPVKKWVRPPREPRGPPLPHFFGEQPQPVVEPWSDAELAERRAAVRAAMQHAWAGYETYAWGYDELCPVSKKGKNDFGGLGATPVDSLDTLHMMGA